MSIVASFVSECARSGRWIRGLLALHGSLTSKEIDISKARIQLATTILDKHWCTALDLVRPSDISYVDELCHFIYECSRSASVPSDLFFHTVKVFLQATRENNETQNQLFVSAINWTSWNQALQFFTMLKSPEGRSIQELSDWLRLSRMFGSNDKRHIINTALAQLHFTDPNKLNVKTRTNLNLKREIPFFLAPSQQEKHGLANVLNSLKSTEYLSMASVMRIATATLRGENVSWKLALSLVSKHRVVKDSNELFAKLIGVCCPQNWLVALDYFELNGKTALWLASCQSWKAGLILAQSNLLPSREAYDILSRSVIPNTESRKLITVTGASRRIDSPSKKAIAASLASGYLLEEIQLSPFSKACHRTGDWESALFLFNRIGTNEFQRRAISSLLESCPNITMEQVLGLVSTRHPASISTTSMMIKHSNSWLQALNIMRHVMARGGRCNPQVLSAFMDLNPPFSVLSQVLKKLKHATNEGIRRRLKSLENDGLSR
ncbi:hypothetical protein TraAM80_04960 [Trypanosoma rangeli]|uniref:Uncharacterized protein n=1 Tax=Trypanosoma rangeli TaxID=5698 RepID=A0A422NHB0_TRYRA|nr:uncharacterized protein TraAM80_04960 [Trypanosoma rangeli]RNF04829.1 hypothetical protein TraAM80_04960 [Trypanosoma rangeli]|eukprot:RNF04829.1 hypothetical protein TraAM80_04960 [Trypanosoma rangeli]